MAGRSPNWTRGELILALDLYVHSGRRALDDRNPRVVELSDLLRILPIWPRLQATRSTARPRARSFCWTELGIIRRR